MTTPARNYSDLDRAYHLHSFTDLSKHRSEGARIIDRGEGIYLVDANGDRYLDAMSSLWCATLGYSEKRLVDAAHQQMQKLPYSHTFRGRSHAKLVELSEKIVEVAPGCLTKVFFAGSGSEANESAVKIAWSVHKRHGNRNKRKIISRFNGYHGSTVFASRLSGMPSMHEYMNMDIPEILYAGCPDYLNNGHENESESDYASRLAMELDEMIQKEGADTIAAFIAEPVMGVGGVVLPPETYFEKIQAVLKYHDILFIADEIVCGFGRTGQMFGSITYGIEPDILTMAKGISSAYFPISAVAVREDVYDALVKTTEEIGVFSHGFTYSGHPAGAAIALETIEILEERDILGHVRTVGELLQSELSRLDKYPFLANFRGIGLMVGFDLFADRGTGRMFDSGFAAGARLMELTEKHHLFTRAVGDTIVIAPPLIISEDEVGILVDLLEAAVSDFDEFLKQSGLKYAGS